MSCGRCATRFEPQIFAWDDHGGVYDVTTAYLLAASYAPVELPAEIVNEFLAINWSESFEPAHMDHVDLELPAMVVTINGQVGMIDGTHRLAERQVRGLPLRAYILTESDTHACELPPALRRLLSVGASR